jgi:mRNA interferase MazF
MERFMKAEVVIIPFPFSDLSGSKRRPALVIGDWGGEDVILCQITSKAKTDGIEVSLSSADFESGKLPVDSNIRPNKIFTADRKSIAAAAGKIKSEKYDEVIHQLVKLIS